MKESHRNGHNQPFSDRWVMKLGYGILGFLVSVTTAFVHAEAVSRSAVDEDVIKLPPFQVSPTEGWNAQDTFSGTRLRTSFRDLANQIETVTPDFMEDFGLNTIEDAAIYTINVEPRSEYVDGTGYAKLPDASNYENSLNTGLRIRGQEGVELTRMFFRTMLLADRYNHGRLDISSGPNSILSASRGHAGSINADPNPAVFSNGANFGAQFDSFGSMRFELNLNQVLVEETLAVRGALLYSDRGYAIEPSHNNSRRYYGTLTYKPFNKTKIQAYYEYAQWNRNIPPQAVPYDRVTPWNEASSLPDSGYSEDRPIFLNNLAWQDTTRPTIGQSVFAKGRGFPIQVLENGNSAGISLLSSGLNSVEVDLLRNWPHISPLDPEPHTLLDDQHFPTDINVSGDASFQEGSDRIFNFVFNQQISDVLFLEIAGHSEKMKNLNALGTGGVDWIYADGNAYLSDGITPNPNVGKYYLQAQPMYDVEFGATGQARVTMAFEYDFKEKHHGWLRSFGRHQLVGIGSVERTKTKWQRRFYSIVPKQLPDGALQFPNIDGITWKPNRIWHHSGQEYKLQFRHYLDPSTGLFTASLPFTIGRPIHLVDSAGDPFTVDPENTGVFDAKGRRLTTGTTDGSVKYKEDAYIFSYQGHLWDDRITLTYGRRKNKYNGGSFPYQRDWPTKMVVHLDDGIYEDYDFPDKGYAEIKGIVFAPFRDWLDLPAQGDLKVYYQRSSSFNPKFIFHDPYGNRYPGSHGEGEDAGLRLSLAGNRLGIRLNYYKVRKGPDIAKGQPYNGLIVSLANMEERVRELDPEIPLLSDIPGKELIQNPNQLWYGLKSDSVSTGYEVSGHWVASDNLEFRFNVADLDVVRSNLGVEWWRWMDERLPTYQSLDIPEGGAEDPQDMDGDGVIGRWTWETAWLGDAIKTPLAESWEYSLVKGQNGRDLIQSLEGQSDPFIRDLRFNVNGMYRFTEGSLRGLQLGGAVRWREAPLLSHGATTVNGYPALNVDERHYGVSEWYLDLVARYRFSAALLGDRTTTVGLNVRNALNRVELIPFLTDVNGYPVRMARVEGIKFILSLRVEL